MIPIENTPGAYMILVHLVTGDWAWLSVFGGYVLPNDWTILDGGHPGYHGGSLAELLRAIGR